MSSVSFKTESSVLVLSSLTKPRPRNLSGMFKSTQTLISLFPGVFFLFTMQCSLSALPAELSLQDQESYVMSQLLSVSPQMHPLLFLAWLCVQEVETSSFAPLHPADARGRLGDLSPPPLSQAMVFPVAVLSGMAMTLVKWPQSHGHSPHWFPTKLFPPICSESGVSKASPYCCPWRFMLCSFLLSTFCTNYFQLTHWRGQGIHASPKNTPGKGFVLWKMEIKLSTWFWWGSNKVTHVNILCLIQMSTFESSHHAGVLAHPLLKP